MDDQIDTIFEIAKNMGLDLDEGQRLISDNLDKLTINLEQKSKNFLFPFLKNSNDFKGLYIYGGVGRGKSMIMDIFFENIRLENKRRMHFHDFITIVITVHPTTVPPPPAAVAAGTAVCILVLLGCILLVGCNMLMFLVK